ncbi:MAG: hypothetical protein IJA94_02575 [Bacilli bacterium]|nr:hypothetical protein [Bacilli bacterium]
MGNEELKKLMKILERHDLIYWKNILSKYNISYEVLQKILSLDKELTDRKIMWFGKFIEDISKYIELDNDILITFLEHYPNGNRYNILISKIETLKNEYTLEKKDVIMLTKCPFGFLEMNEFFNYMYIHYNQNSCSDLLKEYVEFACSGKCICSYLTLESLYRNKCPFNYLNLLQKVDIYFLREVLTFIKAKIELCYLEKIVDKLIKFPQEEKYRSKLRYIVSRGLTGEEILVLLNHHFTDEQIIYLRNLIQDKLDLSIVQIIARPKYSLEKMRYLVKLFHMGYDINKYKKFNQEQLKYIILGLDKKLDVSIYVNSHFDAKQMELIYYGLLNNDDVSKVANTNYSYEQMEFLLMVENFKKENKTLNVSFEKLFNPSYDLKYMETMFSILSDYELTKKEQDFIFNPKFAPFVNMSYKSDSYMNLLVRALKLNGLSKLRELITDKKSNKIISLLVLGLANGFNDEKIEFLQQHHYLLEEQLNEIVSGLIEGLSVSQVFVYAKLHVDAKKMNIIKKLLLNGVDNNLAGILIQSGLSHNNIYELQNYINANYTYDQLNCLASYMRTGWFEDDIKQVNNLLNAGVDEEVIQNLVNPNERLQYSQSTIYQEVLMDDFQALLLAKKQ